MYSELAGEYDKHARECGTAHENGSNSVLVSSDISCLLCLSVCSEVIYVALVEDSVQLTFTETLLLSV